MERKVHIGVLGAANIAIRSVIPAIQQLNDCFELVGVASREVAGSQSKLSHLNTKVVDGYSNILNRKYIDAVYIPLPNSLHYEWVKTALERGIHVLVEKSLACTYDEVVELNKIAEANNLVLIENFQFRFHSQLAYIRNLLLQGTLGDLRIVRSTFCFPPFPDPDNIRYQRALGGGALLDAGAYPIKLSQLILGNDLTVTSATLNSGEDKGVDIWGGAYLKQRNGTLFSQVAFGFDNYYQCNLEIIGTKGKLFTNRIFTAGEKVKPLLLIETQENGRQEITLEPDNHFKNMLYYFYEVTTNVKEREQEYAANINQARLLKKLREKSYE
ncbi:Gfo/Idh/MocA family protein [Parapedobacter sp. 10938]|uniref:Gfo/Idh/MocA family protein n=1 Tax=Parapedobacter flavus TaxID=3110225 RepID=UPI002DBBA96A|nr:Gfo/Idh/MocA family oxidoreductase [Parapedobacter sp. 10938]MEC3880157.1 Gfo/Idh/MocA family oxidoreductase [Parapedobacter sp. 10938]